VEDIEPSLMLPSFELPAVAAPVSGGRNTQSAELCYGMVSCPPQRLGPSKMKDPRLTVFQIYRARVKLVGSMSTVMSKLNSESMPQTAAHYLFGLRKNDKDVMLTFPDGTILAMLNTHLSKALEILLGDQPLYFDVLVHASTLEEAIGAAEKAADATTNVNINVYGPTEERDRTGHHLSKHKVWLQRPDWCRPQTTYDNPHVLRFPGASISAPSFHVTDTTEERSGRLENEAFQSAVSDVYASLQRATHLTRLQGDARLSRKLLPYVTVFH